MLADMEENSASKQFYDNEKSWKLLFNAHSHPKRAKVWIPRILMLPLKIVLEVSTKLLIAWEVYLKVCEFEEGRAQEIKDLKTPIKN